MKDFNAITNETNDLADAFIQSLYNDFKPNDKHAFCKSYEGADGSLIVLQVGLFYDDSKGKFERLICENIEL